MGKRLEIKVGEKHNSLTLLEEVPCRSNSRMVKCFCECGQTKVVRLQDVISGKQKSCGCLRRERCIERSTKHGLCSEYKELYTVINDAIKRCTNPNCKSYKHYGARGIKVCSEWMNDKHAFVVWALANGWKKGLDLDREDNDGDYTPTNCRFVERHVNINNRRCTRFSNTGDSLAELYRAAESPSVSYTCFLHRVEDGWDVKVALTAPSRYASPLVKLYKEADNPPVTYQGFVYRVRTLGWDVNKALTTPAKHRGVK